MSCWTECTTLAAVFISSVKFLPQMRFCFWQLDKIWSAAQYVMSAVVYNVGYDNRMKNMVNDRLLAATKEKKNFARRRSL